VCVARAGTDIHNILSEPNSVLARHKEHVLLVEEPVQNVISSSMVRWLLGQGKPVRYLVPDSVLAYIRRHGLYSTYAEGEEVMHV
jgi:nicotinamide mononucleotide adenylyltransferase